MTNADKIRYIPELFEHCSKLESRYQRVKALRQFASESEINAKTLRKVVEATFHPKVVWALPEGTPPFNVNPAPDYNMAPQSLMKVARKLHYFLECNSMIKHTLKREKIFTQYLEGMYKAEADLLLQMKERKFKWKGVTEGVFREAFPDWLPAKEKPSTKKS